MAEDRRAPTADAVYPCRLCGREFSDRSNRARHERNTHADGVGSVQPSSQSVARMTTKESCAVVQAAGDSVSPPVLPASTTGFTIHEEIRTAIESLLDTDFGRPVPVLVAQLQAKIPSLSSREALVAVAAASAAVKHVHASHQNLTTLREEGDTSRVKSIIARRLVYLGEGPQWNLPEQHLPDHATVRESGFSSPLDLTANEERNALVGDWIARHRRQSSPSAALGAPLPSNKSSGSGNQGQREPVQLLASATSPFKPSDAERHPKQTEPTPLLSNESDDPQRRSNLPLPKDPTPPASCQQSANSACGVNQPKSKEPSPPAHSRTHSISITCRSTLTSCDTYSVSSANVSASPSPKRSSRASTRLVPSKAVVVSSRKPSPRKPSGTKSRDAASPEQLDRRQRSSADHSRRRSPSTSGHGRQRHHRDRSPPPSLPSVSRDRLPQLSRRSPPPRRGESERGVEGGGRHSRRHWGGNVDERRRQR